MVPLAIYGVSGLHAGLALATSLAAWLNAGLLYRTLRKRDIYRPGRWWRVTGVQVGLASAAMLGFLLWGSLEAPWLEYATLERVGALTWWVVAGMGVYVLVLAGTGMRPRHLRGPAGTE